MKKIYLYIILSIALVMTVFFVSGLIFRKHGKNLIVNNNKKEFISKKNSKVYTRQYDVIKKIKNPNNKNKNLPKNIQNNFDIVDEVNNINKLNKN